MGVVELQIGDSVEPDRGNSPSDPGARQHLWRELRGSRKGRTAGVLVLLVVGAAILGPLISPYSPSHQTFSLALAGPSWRHPLGSDELGRDVLTRMLYGARQSLALAVLVSLISAVVGTVVGAVAGYLGGIVESVLMRLTDFMLTIPWLLAVLVLVSVLGTGFRNLVIVLSAVIWARYARVVRAEALSLRERDFILAADVMGSSKLRTLRLHILPNIAYTVIVVFGLLISTVMLAEVALTYLGLGLQPPNPSWGGMISDGQSYLQQAPWIVLGPGAMLILTVIAINLIGDWLRDALDPGLRVE